VAASVSAAKMRLPSLVYQLGLSRVFGEFVAFGFEMPILRERVQEYHANIKPM
jgi:hypothetical protein